MLPSAQWPVNKALKGRWSGPSSQKISQVTKRKHHLMLPLFCPLLDWVCSFASRPILWYDETILIREMHRHEATKESRRFCHSRGGPVCG